MIEQDHWTVHGSAEASPSKPKVTTQTAESVVQGGVKRVGQFRFRKRFPHQRHLVR